MYIKTTKSKGHEYLYLVEEVYQQGAKKTLLLERLGRTDLIAPKTLDTIRSHSVDGRKYTAAARKLGSPSPSANSYAGRAVALVTRAAGLQPIK